LAYDIIIWIEKIYIYRNNKNIFSIRMVNVKSIIFLSLKIISNRKRGIIAGLRLFEMKKR